MNANYAIISFVVLLVSCTPSPKHQSDNIDFEEIESADYYESEDEFEENADFYGFRDGIYTATVDYHNPNTDYYATYTLEVEVQDNEVIVIYFPKGGYVDDDHIWPSELDDSGYAFVEGENGITYEVQIQY